MRTHKRTHFNAFLPLPIPYFLQGQYTEKRVYLNSKLPTWVSSWVPAIFYVTEKAWNYYPYTITEYSCSFLPRFSVHIETRYEVRIRNRLTIPTITAISTVVTPRNIENNDDNNHKNNRNNKNNGINNINDGNSFVTTA